MQLLPFWCRLAANQGQTLKRPLHKNSEPVGQNISDVSDGPLTAQVDNLKEIGSKYCLEQESQRQKLTS